MRKGGCSGKRRRLGKELIKNGLVTKDQVSIGLKEQCDSGKLLGECLVALEFISESIMRDALGEMLGQESIDLSTAIPDVEAIVLLPRSLAIRYTVVPVGYDVENNILSLATTDLSNLIMLDRVQSVVGQKVKLNSLLAGECEIKAAIDQFYGYELSVDGILHEIETGEMDGQSLDAEGEEYSQPLVRLVDAILVDAVRRGASDIHFEPEEGFLRLRFRIDGVMRQVRSLHRNYWSAIVVRLKVMSNMNIAESRIPQDGRISLQIRGHTIDFRVSAQPTSYGENIVLRVLDRTKGIVPLENLGLQDGALSTLKVMLARPEGIILVTGPTGSGKTTTLYSILKQVSSEEVNVMTLEDPVEYAMSLIRQTSINEVQKMDFASGIRSIMRQDPDIILVGEVRDPDTAEMAFRAAMTGHQVFTTLHTNSALGSIPRLLNIGIMPEVLSGNIIGIIGQRLLRVLCNHCKHEKVANEVECLLLGMEGKTGPVIIFDAGACENCDNTGYRGRFAVTEILRMDRDIDKLIADNASLVKLRDHALSTGFTTLADDAVSRILQGITSIGEVSRVIDLTDRLH